MKVVQDDTTLALGFERQTFVCSACHALDVHKTRSGSLYGERRYKTLFILWPWSLRGLVLSTTCSLNDEHYADRAAGRRCRSAGCNLQAQGPERRPAQGL